MLEDSIVHDEREQAVFDAVTQNKIDQLRTLIALGYPLNGLDDCGEAPIQTAIFWGYEDIAVLLCNAGVKIYGLYDQMLTLSVAAKYGWAHLAQALLDRILNDATLNDEEKKKLINGRGKKEPPLHVAIENDHIDIVRILLKNDIDIEGLNCWGQTALHVAARANRKECATLLLESGCKIDAVYKTTRDKIPMTSMQVAIQHNQWDMVILLANRGAEIKSGDLAEKINEGVYYKDKKVLEFLAKVNQQFLIKHHQFEFLSEEVKAVVVYMDILNLLNQIINPLTQKLRALLLNNKFDSHYTMKYQFKDVLTKLTQTDFNMFRQALKEEDRALLHELKNYFSENADPYFILNKIYDKLIATMSCYKVGFQGQFDLHEGKQQSFSSRIDPCCS